MKVWVVIDKEAYPGSPGSWYSKIEFVAPSKESALSFVRKQEPKAQFKYEDGNVYVLINGCWCWCSWTITDYEVGEEV